MRKPAEAAGCGRDARSAACFVLVLALSLPAPASAQATPTCNGVPAAIVGTDGDDKLQGTAGDDVIFTGSGSDIVEGSSGRDRICGGDGDDELDGGAGNDILVGGKGDDDLIGYQGPTFTDDGPDILLGGGGRDRLTGLAGDDFLDGGTDESGFGDTVVFLNAAYVTLRGGTATGVEGNDVLFGIENVLGSDDPDFIIGDDNSNFITGFGGDDQIWGRGGNDGLSGEAGDDLIYGGAGSVDGIDFLSPTAGVTVDLAAGTAIYNGGTDRVEGIELVFGTPYADTLRGDAGHNYFEGGEGNDTMEGRANSDLVSFQSGPAVRVDLAAGIASGQGSDTLIAIENVLGSEEADTIVANAENNLLFGASGADVLSAGAGDDYILADPEDSASGDDGSHDLISFGLVGFGVTVDLTSQTMQGATQTGTVSGFEAVNGSAFGDRLLGDAGVNYFKGSGGDDVLQGKAGDDRIHGESGSRDRATGGDGDDGCGAESEKGCESNAQSPEHPLADEAELAERRLLHRRLLH